MVYWLALVAIFLAGAGKFLECLSLHYQKKQRTFSPEQTCFCFEF
jgi:hypothetical protein